MNMEKRFKFPRNFRNATIIQVMKVVVKEDGNEQHDIPTREVTYFFDLKGNLLWCTDKFRAWDE